MLQVRKAMRSDMNINTHTRTHAHTHTQTHMQVRRVMRCDIVFVYRTCLPLSASEGLLLSALSWAIGKFPISLSLSLSLFLSFSLPLCLCHGPSVSFRSPTVSNFLTCHLPVIACLSTHFFCRSLTRTHEGKKTACGSLCIWAPLVLSFFVPGFR